MRLLILSILAISISLTTNSFAQGLICVSNGDTPEFYTSLVEAVGNSNPGDSLFLPSGVFSEEITIQHELHILGTGMDGNHPTVGNTIFPNTIKLGPNADNSTFSGIHFSSLVRPTDDYNDISGLEFNRCRIFEIRVDFSIGGGTNNNDWTFNECSIAKIRLYSISDILFNNCIIATNEVSRNSTATYNNCIVKFSGNGNGIHDLGFGKNFDNCIIYIGGNTQSSYANTFEDCVFISQFTGPFASNSYFDLGCHYLADDTGLFVNNEDPDLSNISGNNDLNVASSSVAFEAGSDGEDIGIYGGVRSWKNGSLPSNPAVILFEVSPQSDEDGNLQLNIQVEAQDN